VVIVLDTSGLLAAIDSSQRFHDAAKETLGGAVEPLILSPFVLAELDYLLTTRVGREAGLALLEEVARGTYRLAQFSIVDVAEARRISVCRLSHRPRRYIQRGVGEPPRHARRAYAR
jgi:uncharacterized protein